VRRAGAATVVAVAVLTLGACGGGEGAPPDDEAIRTTLTTYLGAVARGDARVACDQLGEGARRDLVRSVRGAENCQDAVRRYRSGITREQRDQLRAAKVTAVRVDGDRATAKVLGGAESGRLQRRDGRWVIAGR